MFTIFGPTNKARGFLNPEDVVFASIEKALEDECDAIVIVFRHSTPIKLTRSSDRKLFNDLELWIESAHEWGGK